MAASADFHHCTQPVPVRLRANEFDLEEMDRLPLRKIADENLRALVKLIRHDVQIAVIVEIEDRGRAAAQRAHERHFASLAGAFRVLFVRSVAIERKPELLRAPVSARLDAK